MDLNQLLYNHQLAMLKAQAPEQTGKPMSSFDMVGFYAKRIRAWRHGEGLSSRGWPGDLGSCLAADLP